PAHHEQSDSSDERQYAQNRRKRNRVGLILFNLQRSNLGHLFLRREVETAVRERDDADDNQDDRKQCDGLHLWLSFISASGVTTLPRSFGSHIRRGSRRGYEPRLARSPSVRPIAPAINNAFA